jgi:hypothetical protein
MNLADQNFAEQWTVYRTRFVVRARQLTEPLVFTDALGREQSGNPGDYVVETSEGLKRITTKALFEDIYVPLVVRNGAPGVVARPVSRASPENRPKPDRLRPGSESDFSSFRVERAAISSRHFEP